MSNPTTPPVPEVPAEFVTRYRAIGEVAGGVEVRGPVQAVEAAAQEYGESQLRNNQWVGFSVQRFTQKREMPINGVIGEVKPPVNPPRRRVTGRRVQVFDQPTEREVLRQLGHPYA